MSGWQWLLVALGLWLLASIPIGLLVGRVLRHRRHGDSDPV